MYVIKNLKRISSIILGAVFAISFTTTTTTTTKLQLKTRDLI